MSRSSHWRRRALVVVAVLLVLVAAFTWTIRRVGQWLVVEDQLEPAQAIVVLSGRMPARALEAAEIYRQGFAPEIWISRPISAREELHEMGIEYVGEETYNQMVLVHLGVPSKAIRVLQTPAGITEEEVEQISQALRSEGAKSVIAVTSRPHTRRVKTIWKSLVGDNPRLIVRYAPEDKFDPGHWWRHSRDALDVVREVLGLMNAWAGFPARPPNP